MAKSNENWALMMSAAKQYYQLGLSQDIIAKNLYVSKSTVSRLIKRAVELGYIEFKINNFGETDEMLQNEFQEHFGVKTTVLPTLIDSIEVRLNDVCAFAAKEIFDQIQDGESIGLPWGRTVEYLAANLNEQPAEHSNLKVCMLNGFVSSSINSMRAIHIVEKLTAMLNATGYMMPCPLVVDSPDVKEKLLADASVRAAYDVAAATDTVIVSVGPADLTNTYLTELRSDVAEQLRAPYGVGNLAGRVYDINGVEIHTALYDRLMSIPIHELAAKKKRICIAVGEYKARAVLGLLRGSVVSRLYTDVNTAREILHIQKETNARWRA